MDGVAPGSHAKPVRLVACTGSSPTAIAFSGDAFAGFTVSVMITPLKNPGRSTVNFFSGTGEWVIVALVH